MKTRNFWLLSALLPALMLWGCGGGEGGGTETEYEPATATVSASNQQMPGGGTLTAEFADSPMGGGIRNLVDNNAGTKFITPHNDFWVVFSGDEAQVVNFYSITSASDAPNKDPKSWGLYGSNDNTQWSLIDRRTDQVFGARKSTKEFEVDNTTAYKYYKLEVTANSGGETTQIAEWSLKYVSLNIDDLMDRASGRSNSTVTPMGNHFERVLNRPADPDFMNNPLMEPDLQQSSMSGAMWKEFPVTLYPSGGKPIPSDCNQRGIGDCCAIAVFASFAYIYPEFIKNIIRDNGDRTYTVSMFDPAGNPVDVTVSNQFIADSGGTIQSVAGKGGVACWSTVLEKAMMKWQKVYQANYEIGGIGTEHVVPLFTGNGNSFAFDEGRLSNEELKRAVEVCLKTGSFVIGGFRAKNGVEIPIGTTGGNTIGGHAYTFMHSPNQSALFVMRNPWGGHTGLPDNSDGLIHIPNDDKIPPIIDLRIVEPGKASRFGNGVSSPYSPPAFTRAQMGMHVSPELMRR